ncbi:MAG: metallophosphoesterase family protein [Gemmatimonadota bacterium]|nr:metallophosphoesterase family protein [Gemmatimonadota bacterium]
MRYAIISDIHGNLQALEEVLGLIGRLDVERIVCLGDIVGYGGDPSPCIELVRRNCCRVIMGNHDAAAVELTSIEFFNPAASAATLWTRDVLTREEKEYLAGLPLKEDFASFEIVHSTPDDPEQWRYLLMEDDAGPLFDCFSRQVLFYGHTHNPLVFRMDGRGVTRCGALDLTLESEARYIVNVGSVGQPRDSDPRASFAVFDIDNNKITFHRQPYDIAGAKERILDNGLPGVLAGRLDYGL